MRLPDPPRPLLFALSLIVLTACGPSADSESGVVRIQYWEKWTSFEADAMRAVVDRFNAEAIENSRGRRIVVDYLSTSQIDSKLLLAAAGRNPPDVAGFWSERIASFAEKGALYPLDSLMARDGLALDDYLGPIAEQLRYRGVTWALPSAPQSLALHYNRRLFREAGLDPTRPPQTIAELDEYAARLTIRSFEGERVTQHELEQRLARRPAAQRAEFRRRIHAAPIEQLGFSPTQPGWWNSLWSIWFDAELIADDAARVTCESAEVVESLEWIRSYPERYGRVAIERFLAGSGGQFDSPENPFFAEKLGMVLQGVWLSAFIDRHNPDLEWGATAFPAVRRNLRDVSIVSADILVIPNHCKHVEEAWTFIKFVQRPRNMELLCRLQKKFSPLVEVTPHFEREAFDREFYRFDPLAAARRQVPDAQRARAYAEQMVALNPEIHVFRQLAESPNARYRPQIPVFSEYEEELNVAFNYVWIGQSTPRSAMERVARRIQPKLDRALAKWNLIEDSRREQWARWQRQLSAGEL